MAVFAPMARARVRTMVAVNPGARRRVRTACRRSRRASSSETKDRASRWSSFACSTPPKALRAASRASSWVRPRRRNSSSRRPRWDATSRARSASVRPGRRALWSLFRNRRRPDMVLSLRSGFVQEELLDQAHQTAPTLGLLAQGAPAGPGDAVVLGLAIGLGPLPGALDPAPLLQSDESGVQRALIEGKRRLRDLLEARREAIGLLRSHRVQGPQHDQVESPLEKLPPFRGFTGHSSGLLSCSLAELHLSVKWTSRPTRWRVDARAMPVAPRGGTRILWAVPAPVAPAGSSARDREKWGASELIPQTLNH